MEERELTELEQKSLEVENDKFAVTVELFRSLPDQTRYLFALREVIRLAAKAGDELSQECFAEDPGLLLKNLRDAFLFRMSWPEHSKSTK